MAVRYCREDEAPEGAIRLFGEQELFPVCSPALLSEGPRPLRIEDLAGHALLRMDEAAGPLDWGTWLAAHGLADLKPRATLRFDSYEQMIGAALSGQGVAMGIGSLVRGLIEEGRLVAPFANSVTGTRAYYIVRSGLTGTRPHVQAFVDWLVEAAKTVLDNRAKRGQAKRLSSPPPAARSGGATRRARSKP